MGWVFVIIAGIIIGLLGKFIAPGSRDNTPLWLTIVCGIVGVLIGYGLFGGTNGIDWTAFLISVLIAAVLVVVASTVTGRNSTRRV
ncbi:MAG TPA: GlsB/YeaQ/YmgE family stress response membrane protein [Marmoricola sp.]|nr:GlsB/YeaQ/YmgE family stress response membrane protein [Marmoricola sp.]